MNRRTTLMLTGMALLGLAMATLPQLGFAHGSPLIGTWKLNLDKSKYSPGPPPRSNTLTLTQDGQNIRDTNQGTDAQGNATGGVLMINFDGQPHPSTGFPNFDAVALTRLDADTFIFARFKAGKLVATGTAVVSQDGKTETITSTGIDANGRPLASTTVYDKQ
jgi:hypothetical protein